MSPRPQPMQILPCYRYAATLERVIDGDTLVVHVDVGFKASFEMTVRLVGVNAPEKVTTAGKQAAMFTASWLAAAPLIIDSAKPRPDSTEKYGRWLARVFNAATGACLNDDLLATGHAVAMEE